MVINAHAGRGQLKLLKRIYGRYTFDHMKVAVITSTSGTDEGQDYNEFKVWNKFEYVQYCEIKKELMQLKVLENLLKSPGLKDLVKSHRMNLNILSEMI